MMKIILYIVFTDEIDRWNITIRVVPLHGTLPRNVSPYGTKTFTKEMFVEYEHKHDNLPFMRM